jgi:hypothetical protein
MELLEDEFDFVRSAAARAVSKLSQKRAFIASAALDGLSAALFDDSASVRVAAMAALASCCMQKAPNAGVIKAMRAALDDSSAAVRLAAVLCATLLLFLCMLSAGMFAAHNVVDLRRHVCVD